MYRDRLLKFSVFPFSLKGGIWLFGASAWSVGLLDRTLSTFSDGQIVAGEVPQLIIIITALVCWFYLKPSSRLDEQFFMGNDDTQNVDSRERSMDSSMVSNSAQQEFTES